MKNSPPHPLTDRILPTFFYYAIPSTISLIAITTATLVDAMFIGHQEGANALAAIALLSPYFTLLIAITLMIAIGSAVRAATLIAANRLERTSQLFSQALLITFGMNLAIAFASVIFDDALFELLSAPDDTQALMSEYFDIIRWVLIIQSMSLALYYFVRLDRHPTRATCALVVGAAANIILDYIFIVEMNLGLSGAAYATALAQVVQMTILVSYFASSHRQISFILRPRHWAELRYVVTNGFSELVNELSIAFLLLLINALVIARLGISGIAAFSLINYFIFLSVMLSYGIADTLHLLVGQNHGAKQFQRERQFLRTGLVCTVVLGTSIVITLSIWQVEIIDALLSNADFESKHIAYSVWLLIWPLFFVNGVNIVLSGYLTARQEAKPSAVIAISRCLIFPCLLLISFYHFLPFYFPDLSGEKFLIALPIAEIAAFILATMLVLPKIRRN